MPVLILADSDDGQSFSLNKPLISVGKDPENDIVVNGDGVESAHAHIVKEGDTYVISPVEPGVVQVNGKKRSRYKLAVGDVVGLGSVSLTYALEAPKPEKLHTMGGPSRAGLLNGYRRLQKFSSRLAGKYEIETLVGDMLDEIIDVLGADKGFLILLEDGTPVVKVARHVKGETEKDQLSDSIVQRVLERREPLIVSDAMNDTLFSRSKSVVELELSSVMCVPLLHQADLLGVIYVGNDQVANLFNDDDLDVLQVFAAQASLALQNAAHVQDLMRDRDSLRQELDDIAFGEIIGSSGPMKRIFKMIEKVALADISVLVEGETGTGKELIAKEIHRRSPRGKGPFVAVNCGAIPENLLESELFGHARGAFTGAVADRMGKFEAANKGTLFLDEVGEMAPQLQVKLLRVLQEKTVERVGENKPRKVDIRIVAATNKNLQEEVASENFREDLYYRLNEVKVGVPPLRDRGEDVILIANYYIKRFAKEFDSNVKGFTPDASLALKKYAWPGNIRQLENKIKKAIVMAEKPRLTVEDLELSRGYQSKVLPLSQAVEEFKEEYIDEVLDLNNGNRTKTARDLDVDPRTVFRHLEKKRGGPLDKPDKKSDEDD